MFLFSVIVVPLSKLPLNVLYGLIPVFSFLLNRIFGYRKQVIKDNLERALFNAEITATNDENPKETTQKTTQKYYRHLSKLFVESLKGFGIEKAELLERFKCSNPEILDAYFEQGESVILVSSHYANWEWGAIAAPLYLKHKSVCVYKPISNDFFEEKVNKSRTKYGLELVALSNTYRKIYRQESESKQSEIGNKPSAYILVSDQNPSNLKRAHWIDFFGQKTATIHGPALYANRFDLPIFYIDIKEIKQGYYDCRFEPICTNPKEVEPAEITQRFMTFLEAQIRRQPELWLWSHKRWKHQWKGEGT